MYSEEIISDEYIWEILENANWAPNHRKTEPWRFHVITGDSKNPLSEYAERWYVEHNTDEDFSPIKLAKIKQNIERSSHIIAIIWHREPTGLVPEWEEIAAIACAVQNLWLSAHARGLASYWSTPPHALASGHFLKVRPNETCLGWLYLGVPKNFVAMKAERGEIRNKVTWHK